MRTPRAVFGGVVGAALAVAGAAWYTRGPSPPPPGPVEFPEIVRLGEMRPGVPTVADIPLRNTTAAPVRVFDVRVSCGCLSPTRRVAGGGVETIGELVLAAGETATVVVTGNVANGQATFAHRLSFRTDHPDLHEAAVEVRGTVYRGIVAVPDAVGFDPAYPGDTRPVVVRVTDLRPADRRTPLALSSDHPAVAVRAVPTDGGAELTLTLAGAHPGEVAGEVRVTGADGVVLGVVPFRGRVRPAVELVPSVVLLPRPGTPDPDEARVECRAGVGLTAVTAEAPAGVSVRVDGSFVVIRRAAGTPGARTVRVRARTADGRDHALELPVTCVE